MIRLGYNTNGFAHHSLIDAITILAEIGYQSVAITLDHACLNPFGSSLETDLAEVRSLLDEHELQSVIETGARFLLDIRRKHQPTLLSARNTDRQRRIEFLCSAIDIARSLESNCVSFWSGSADDDADEETLWQRLLDSLRPVMAYAAERDVTLGFEPEPGMFIDTMQRWAELLQRLSDAQRHLQLTLDIGHVHCLGELPIEAKIRDSSDKLVNVHLEDMREGVHEHLMFGEGEMNFAPILAALAKCGYNGGVHVELSRHSHCAVETAERAYGFLTSLDLKAHEPS